MKTNIVLLIGSLAAQGLQGPNALAATNTLYVTDDRTVFHGETNLFTKERIERARQARESRPSEVDIEGNWGPTVEGFQLSIRLDKRVYTNGEPIQVRVILRNVAGKELKYSVRYGTEDDFSFVVKRRGVEIGSTRNSQATNFVQKLATVRAGSSAVYLSPAWTQREYPRNLRELYSLDSKGDYTVAVKRQVPTQDKQLAREISSGVARFHIE